jgi:hypothetical protein
MLVAGVIGTVLSFFFLHRLASWLPALAPYQLLIQLCSVALLVGGAYFKGSYDVELQWRERAAELEANIKVAEEKAKEANSKVVVKYRDKIKVVRDNTVSIQERIKELEKVIDEQCKVAPEAILIHNQAATTPERNEE